MNDEAMVRALAELVDAVEVVMDGRPAAARMLMLTDQMPEIMRLGEAATQARAALRARAAAQPATGEG